VGKALKRIQDAIGEWHDLDALSAEAAQALGSSGRELRERLCHQADEKLHQALDSTERARRRLLGEYLALHLRPRNPRA
jgi:CHAD domain-containing protein